MSDLAGIVARLPGLADAEFHELKLRVNAFLWGRGGQQDVSAARRVFDVIRREMQFAGLVATSESFPYHRLPNRTDFSVKAEQLVVFLEKQHPQQYVQDGILRIGVGLLINSLRKWVARDDNNSDMVDVAMVCRNVHKIPARLDMAFPGYGEAGLLRMLVRDSR